MILAGIITMLPLFTLFFYPEEIGQAQYCGPGVSAISGRILNEPCPAGQKGRRLKRIRR